MQDDENAADSVPDSGPLTLSTYKGLQWTYVASAVGAVLQLGYTAVMGRLLTPTDFGVLAIALVFLRFGLYFAQMGVGPALVQAPTMNDLKVSTAFRMNVALSATFAAIFIASANLSTLLLDDPVVVPVVRVMALSLIISGLGTTAESLLKRQLEFRRLAINKLISFIIGYLIVGISAALLGAGVWSLVAAALSQSAIHVALDLRAQRHPVRAGWSTKEARALISFGGRVSVISFTEFLGGSLDTMVIGRVAGSASLGQYNRAFLLVNLPLERLMQGVGHVLFPALSRIQDQRERLGRVYRSSLASAGALLIPIGAGMALAAAPLVTVVLGDQWAESARVLPFLAISAVGGFLALLGAIVCEATADLNRKLVLQCVHLVALIVLLFLAGSDLRNLALAVMLAQSIRVVGYFEFMRRKLEMERFEHLRILFPAIVTGSIIAAAGHAWNVLFSATVPAAILLIIHVVSGAALLLASLRFGPLSPTRRDVAVWLVKASALERLPARLRQIIGL